MRIIDKQKDYYDFLVGSFGMDEKLIYNRNSVIHNLSDGHYRLVVGTIVQEFAKVNKHIYFGKKLNLVGKKSNTNLSLRNWLRKFRKKINDKYYDVNFRFEGRDYLVEVNSEKYYINPDEVKEYALPIYIEEIFFKPYRNKKGIRIDSFIYTNPNLDGLGLKIFKPEEIWLEVSNFLSKKLTDKEIIINNQTDEQKIISHGFDLKQSFRHRK